MEVAAALVIAVLAAYAVVVTLALIKSERKLKDHLALWIDLLQVFESCVMQTAQIASKEAVLTYAAEEAGAVAKIAAALHKAMVVASASVGIGNVSLAIDRIDEVPQDED